MAEPPILPGDGDLESVPNDSNPFAPSVISSDEIIQGRPRMELTAGYWISIAVVTVSSIGLLLVGFLPAWFGIAATIPAACRVPIIQRKLTRANPSTRLPHPVGMIFASYAFVIAFGVASSIAFVVICVPTTIMFGLASNSMGYYTVGGSALAGLLMFCLLYWASLRLSI